MHRHSAWTVLGVDPATQQAAEALAAQQGTTIGGWLQSVVAERTSSAPQPRVRIAGRQELLPIFQEMVEALGKAAKVLAAEETQSTPAQSTPAQNKSGQKTPTTARPQARAPERPQQPQRPQELDPGSPSFDEIQDWLKRMEAKNPVIGNPDLRLAESGPTPLRRRA